jgi:hypothetical protein
VCESSVRRPLRSPCPAPRALSRRSERSTSTSRRGRRCIRALTLDRWRGPRRLAHVLVHAIPPCERSVPPAGRFFRTDQGHYKRAPPGERPFLEGAHGRPFSLRIARAPPLHRTIGPGNSSATLLDYVSWAGFEGNTRPWLSRTPLPSLQAFSASARKLKPGSTVRPRRRP